MTRLIIWTVGLLLAAPAAAQVAAPQMIGITKAVAAAERALPGRALEAELDARNGTFVYEIELARREQPARGVDRCPHGPGHCQLAEPCGKRLATLVRFRLVSDCAAEWTTRAPIGGIGASVARHCARSEL